MWELAAVIKGIRSLIGSARLLKRAVERLDMAGLELPTGSPEVFDHMLCFVGLWNGDDVGLTKAPVESHLGHRFSCL